MPIKFSTAHGATADLGCMPLCVCFYFSKKQKHHKTREGEPKNRKPKPPNNNKNHTNKNLQTTREEDKGTN